MGVTRVHHRRLARPGGDWLQSITATETLVIFSVLLLLTAVLVPTVRSQMAVTDLLQARYDVEHLQSALMRFYHDTGVMPGQRARGPSSTRDVSRAVPVSVLVTEGSLPQPGIDPECRGWTRATPEMLDDHLVDNKVGYEPREIAGTGWAGPYLETELGPDPWGHCYMINIAYFDDSRHSTDDEGQIKRAVFILSAGPNGAVDTPWSQPVTTASARGDDITVRIQ